MKIKKELIVLLTVLPMVFMCTLDGSIVNVALPTMARELKTTMSGIEWVVTSYLITICATILLCGKLGDVISKGKIFNVGIIIFTIGSLLCGLSSNLTLLIISRVIQAIGASATMATNQGIITQAFKPTERGRALGTIGTAVALGAMVGPMIGGLIVSVSKWQYIFLINIPIGIIVYMVALKVLKNEKESKEKVKIDMMGNTLFIVFIMLLFGAINFGQNIGYANPIIIGAFVLSIISLVIFIRVERKIKNPMLDISIFDNKLFSVSIFCTVTSYVSVGAVSIIMPFYFQDALKLSPGMAGLMMTVSPVILAVVSPLSGYLSDKIGSDKVSFVGLSMLSLTTFLLVILNYNTALALVVILVGLTSVGNGMFQSPNTSLIMSSVDKTKLGVAGSVNALGRNIGMTAGIALSTSLLYSIMSSKIGYHVSGFIEGRADVFIYAMRIVFIGIGAICLIGAIATLSRVMRKDKEIEAKKAA